MNALGAPASLGIPSPFTDVGAFPTACLGGDSLFASDLNGDSVDGERVTTTTADVIPGLGGVSVFEVLLNVHCIEFVSLSALFRSAVDSQMLHILACVILAIADESEQECALLVAPTLILPVDSNYDGRLTMELLPRIGREVVFSLPVGLTGSRQRFVAVGLREAMG